MTRTGLLLAVFLAVLCSVTLTAAQADALVPGTPSYSAGLWTYSYSIDEWNSQTDPDAGYIPAPGHTWLWAIDIGSTADDIPPISINSSTGWTGVTAAGGTWYDSGITPGLVDLQNSNVIIFYWSASLGTPFPSGPPPANPPLFSFSSPRGPTPNLFALSDNSSTPIQESDALGPGDASVPEPSSLALGSLLMLGLGGWRVRRGKRGH